MIKNIKKKQVHEYHTCATFLRVLRRHFPRPVTFFGVVTDAGLVIVDSGTPETVSSPEALRQSVLFAFQKVVLCSRGGNRRGSRTSNDVQTGWNDDLCVVSRVDANTARMVQYFRHRINRCPTVVGHQRNSGHCKQRLTSPRTRWHTDVPTVRMKHLRLRGGLGRARRDMCHGTRPMQKTGRRL